MSKGLKNPAAVMAATEFAKSDTGKETIKATVNAGKIILLVVGVTLGAKYLNKKYKEWRTEKYLNENGHKIEVQAAIIMYKAMYRLDAISLGPVIDLMFGTFQIPDGTDTDALNDLALKVKSKINLVSKAYKIIFDKNFLQDVQSETDREEINAFFTRINSTGADITTPAPSLIPYLKGETVYVRNDNGVVTETGVKQDNGAWAITNDTQGSFSFGDEIGTIYDIKRYADGEIDYIIDEGFWSTGYPVASHRDLLNKHPEN